MEGKHMAVTLERTKAQVNLGLGYRETERKRQDFSDCFIGIKSIFDCTQEELKQTFEKLTLRYAALEKKDLAGQNLAPAGYELHIVNYNKTSPNDVEVYLEACEPDMRSSAKEIELPAEKKPCPFDDISDERLFACEQPTDGLSCVLKTKQQKPLVVSRQHYPHWFK